MNPKWISFDEVAKAVELSRPTARAKLESGDIPGLVDHHGTSRVSREIFSKWLKAQGK